MMDNMKALDDFCKKIDEVSKYPNIQVISFSKDEIKAVYTAILEMKKKQHNNDENDNSDDDLIMDGGTF